MDFKELLSMASNKQKVTEKELATTKKGINTTCSSKNNSVKKKVDAEKQKKLDAIRARVEAQFKPKTQEAKPKGDEEIMDFTVTGLSENDIRRKKLSEAEKAKKQQEFMEKLKRLKDRPIGSEESEPAKVRTHRVPKETCMNGEGKTNESQRKSSSYSKSCEKSKEEKGSREPGRRHERDKSKHKSHKHHKEKHRNRSKESEEKNKSEHSKTVKPEWVSLKKEKSSLPVTTIKKKAPPKGPPPLSFTQLLSMAQENKSKPEEILNTAKKVPLDAEKVETAGKKKPREPDRPMTQEEKERYYRMQTPEYRRWLKFGGPRPASVPGSAKRHVKSGPKSREIIQNSDSDDDDDDNDGHNTTRPSQCATQQGAKGSLVTAKLKHSSASRPDHSLANSNNQSLSGNSIRESKVKHLSSQLANNNKGLTSGVNRKVDALQKQSTMKSKSTKDEPKQKAKVEAQNPWDRIYGEIKQQNQKKGKKQRRDVIDSDEDYDEDLEGFVVDEDDDFIDDSEAQDYSKYISEIFGYDKRKYRQMEEDDLSDMETGFAEQMKEEIRSAKIGLMEDLEDIKMEEEMKKKKKKIRIH